MFSSAAELGQGVLRMIGRGKVIGIKLLLLLELSFTIHLIVVLAGDRGRVGG